MNISKCRFSGVEFEDCDMNSVTWNSASWPRFLSGDALKFFKCDISKSSFAGLELEGIAIEDCLAHGVDFRNGTFSRANFSYTDFTSALFGKTDLTGANFTDSFNYDIDILNNVLSKAKFNRFEAASLLYSIDIELID